jgi:hypothetical protein
MTTFLARENVMKNREQTNTNNLNNPTVANDPQAQVEFDDLSISGEEEERVKGGTIVAVNGGGNIPSAVKESSPFISK